MRVPSFQHIFAFRVSALILLVLVEIVGAHFLCKSAQAHEGPPYPVVMDQVNGPYRVSIWADPDIGEALFYILLESTSKQALVVEPKVTFWTQPLDKRLERADYDAERQQLRGRVQFLVKAHFDKQDMWNVGFILVSPQGQHTEVKFEIESTPDGYGVWDLAIYLFPFLLMGGLWIRALWLRRPEGNQVAHDDEHVSSPIEITRKYIT